VRLVPRLPSSTDVARLLDDCTVLALPSQSEGLPRVVMEAFARARPVVGTDVGGIPDLVRPEHNGLLVPPGDAHLLAEALRRILADRAFAERLGRAGHADLERSLQTPERYAAAVRRLVDRALAAPA
jgi:glycosyltransferase involved in cell wall biosynthesis